MKKFSFLLFLAFSFSGAFAQVKVPRDTSFTLHGTYLKEKKYRPYIEIANPDLQKNVTVKKDIVYSNLNGRELVLDVYYPKKNKADKKFPGVLLIYGGGWRSGDKSQMEAMAKVLATNGYVAVAPEYRLSLEAIYPAAIYDLKASLRWMRENAGRINLDKSKIASLGVSAGGQLAAFLGTTNFNLQYEGKKSKTSSAVQAIVDIDGTLAFHHPESSEGKAASLWLGGTYQEKPEIWEDAAPLNHVDKNTPPILFLNSSNARFHAGRDDMIKKLDSLKIYSEIREFPDTPHPFWFFHPWFNPMMETTVNFLNKVFR